MRTLLKTRQSIVGSPFMATKGPVSNQYQLKGHTLDSAELTAIFVGPLTARMLRTVLIS